MFYDSSFTRIRPHKKRSTLQNNYLVENLSALSADIPSFPLGMHRTFFTVPLHVLLCMSFAHQNPIPEYYLRDWKCKL